MTEDLAVFFDLSRFGTAATWSVGGVPVTGIFDSGYQATQLGLDVGVEGARYAFTCAAAAVPTAAQGQTLTIGAVVYTIRSVQPDGTGLVLLLLHKG